MNEYRHIKLSDLPLDESLKSPPPTPQFIASVAIDGVLQPISVVELSRGAYRVIYGRRRIKASRAVGLETIPAIVQDHIGEFASYRQAIIENQQRSDNPIAELVAVRGMIAKGSDYKEIAESLSIPITHVRKIDHTFGGLDDDFVQAVMDDKVAVGTAMEIAKQKPHVQKKLLTVLNETGKVLGRQVREAKEAGRNDAMKKFEMKLPEMNFKKGLSYKITCGENGGIGATVILDIGPSGDREYIAEDQEFIRGILEDAFVAINGGLLVDIEEI